jgi:hypothetical protein
VKINHKILSTMKKMIKYLKRKMKKAELRKKKKSKVKGVKAR